jgi:predicted ATP-grasp superfamily ATP-dependent carboligase
VLRHVLLTDAEERSVLAACRGLAQAGYRVSTIGSVRPAPTHWSRSCSERFVGPDPRTDAAAFIARLEQILTEGHYALLLPGTEASLRAVSASRERLEAHTELRLPPEQVVARAIDKVGLLGEAERAGLPSPETILCTGPVEAQSAAATLGYPVILKPARSFVEVRRQLTHRSAAIATDEPGLARASAGLPPPFLVQRFHAHRPVLSCSGVVADGALRAVAVARYERTWPPQVGPSCFSETILPPRGLARRVEALVSGLGWEGIFQVQLLEIENRFATLDLNPRLFGSLALPIGAGANLPAVWCDWVLTGKADAAVQARAGVRYRWEEGELRNLLCALRSGRVRAAAAVVVPRRRVVHAYFERTDPVPLVAWGIGLFFRLRRRR